MEMATPAALREARERQSRVTEALSPGRAIFAAGGRAIPCAIHRGAAGWQAEDGGFGQDQRVTVSVRKTRLAAAPERGAFVWVGGPAEPTRYAYEIVETGGQNAHDPDHILRGVRVPGRDL